MIDYAKGRDARFSDARASIDFMTITQGESGFGYVFVDKHDLAIGEQFPNINEAHAAVKEARLLWSEFMERVNG